MNLSISGTNAKCVAVFICPQSVPKLVNFLVKKPLKTHCDGVKKALFYFSLDPFLATFIKVSNTSDFICQLRMGEREADVLRDELAPDNEDNEDTGVREEDFSLESLDMLRVIGTGTFARVCLCQVSGKVDYLKSEVFLT